MLEKIHNKICWKRRVHQARQLQMSVLCHIVQSWVGMHLPLCQDAQLHVHANGYINNMMERFNGTMRTWMNHLRGFKGEKEPRWTGWGMRQHGTFSAFQYLMLTRQNPQNKQFTLMCLSAQVAPLLQPHHNADPVQKPRTDANTQIQGRPIRTGTAPESSENPDR